LISLKCVTEKGGCDFAKSIQTKKDRVSDALRSDRGDALIIGGSLAHSNSQKRYRRGLGGAGGLVSNPFSCPASFFGESLAQKGRRLPGKWGEIEKRNSGASSGKRIPTNTWGKKKGESVGGQREVEGATELGGGGGELFKGGQGLHTPKPEEKKSSSSF